MKTTDFAGTRGIGMVHVLIIMLVVSVVGLASWQALRTKNAVAGRYDAISQDDMFGLVPKPVAGFYSCLDQVKDFTPVLPQRCMYEGVEYTRPVQFTDDNIRQLDRLPDSAKPVVRVIAKNNFDMCSDVPDTLSVTRVLNVKDGFVYLATGCDGGYAVVLVKQGFAWKDINLGQGGLACETAENYKIPRDLMYNNVVTHSGDCYTKNNKAKPLPESYDGLTVNANG